MNGSGVLTGSSIVGFAGNPLSNGLAERLFSVDFEIFGIFGSPDVNGASFFARQFGTFDPNNE